MKKHLLVSLALSSFLFGSIPQSINLHSIAYDSNSNALASSTISVKIEILDRNNNVLYTETNSSVTTDSKGIFSLKVGTQTTTDTFSSIDFNSASKIKIYTDTTAGTNYSIVATEEFSTSPFAFIANKLAGDGNSASGTNAISWGKDTNASGNYSTAFGEGAISDQNYMTSIGKYNSKNNTNALFVVGNGTSDTDRNNSLVVTDQNTSINGKLFVNGAEVTAGGSGSITPTSIATLIATGAINTIGDALKSNAMSLSLGVETNTTEPTVANTMAFMNDISDSTKNTQLSVGIASKATGIGAIALGAGVEASGMLSFASGILTRATGGMSKTWGFNSEANDSQATAWGNGNKASAMLATAWGLSTEASAENSTAFGDSTVADQNNMTAIGTHNTSGNTNALFVVGNGSHYSRSDAFSVYSDGSATLAGALAQNSDERLKTNIKKIDNVIEKVKGINGVTYNWIDEKKDKSTQVGVIAQDVKKVMPELVKEDSNGYLSVSYTNMVGLLIEAIKVQQKEIEKLQNALKNAGIGIEE